MRLRNNFGQASDKEEARNLASTMRALTYNTYSCHITPPIQQKTLRYKVRGLKNLLKTIHNACILPVPFNPRDVLTPGEDSHRAI